MRTSSCIVGGVCVCLTVGMIGCPQNFNNGSKAASDQRVVKSAGEVITTDLDQFVEVVRTKGKDKNYSVLVGAFGTQLNGTFGASVGQALVDSNDASSGEAASVEINSGWAYIISPPRWPLVRTPRVRGGVRADAGGGATTVYVAAYTDGQYDRIFFLGAFNAAGQPATACVLTVESIAPYSPTPTSVPLTVGQYAEIELNTGTLTWSNIRTESLPNSEVAGLLGYVRLRAANHEMNWNPNIVITPPPSP